MNNRKLSDKDFYIKRENGRPVSMCFKHLQIANRDELARIKKTSKVHAIGSMVGKSVDDLVEQMKEIRLFRPDANLLFDIELTPTDLMNGTYLSASFGCWYGGEPPKLTKDMLKLWKTIDNGKMPYRNPSNV